MNSLFVCHSEGDSNALFTTAEALLKKSKEHNVFFLIIGNRAKEKWKGLPVDSILKNLAITEVIPESLIQKSETSPLNQQDFGTIKIILDSFIKKHKIINGLVGTPSQNKSGLAFQIAEELTQHFNNKHVFVYNDYLFEEKAHCYWQVINKKVWGEKINWLVPLFSTKEKVKTINPSLEVNVVGHPSIDAALTEMPSNKGFVREELGINESESLLFISGSKDLSEDRELLETLFQTLQKNLNPKLQLRLGIHPGVSNPDKYIAEILKKIEEFPSVTQQVKLLLKPNVASQTKLLQKANKHYILQTSLSGDQIACAADSVASTSPATLITIAALQGKPAYCHTEDKPSYLPTNRLFAGKDRLSLFFSEVEKQKTPQPMTRSDLGLASNQAFPEAMSEQLTLANRR